LIAGRIAMRNNQVVSKGYPVPQKGGFAMRYHSLLALVATLAVLSQTVSAAEKVSGRVLYAGNPGSARAKDFVSFLEQHFTKVAEISYEKFVENDAKGFDVVIFDWTSIYPRDNDCKVARPFTSLRSPKPPHLSRDFDRPAILIGAAGAMLARQFQLKIDWL
jgi:hypothetical protein